MPQVVLAVFFLIIISQANLFAFILSSIFTKYNIIDEVYLALAIFVSFQSDFVSLWNLFFGRAKSTCS